MHNDSPKTLTGSALASRFAELDRFLLEHQRLWRPRPFVHYPHLPWETELPELSAWLREQSLEHAETAHNQPHELDAPQPFVQLAQRALQLSRIGPLPQQPDTPLDPRLSNAVPGRKWLQIENFTRSISFTEQPTHWLDWCSGKGHLGRALAHKTQPLTCYEHNAELVADGQRLSKKLGINAQHICQDVLAETVPLSADYTAVALHACGELHTRLLQLASQSGCKQLAVAPCCYNRISTQHYQPLSNAARQSTLHLSIDDLSLPLSETVTAGARVRRQRDESMARRLAFDLLQRKLRGINEYLPTPSLPTAWLDKPFAQYCADLAALKQLPQPTNENWELLAEQGWQRLAAVRNLELVRNLFRRPLELWLLLDRALYLQEHAYNVQLGTFCSREQSPRNILLLAERAAC